MPNLSTTLHLEMLKRSNGRQGLLIRILKAIKREVADRGIYGLEWGDPEFVEPLRFIRDRYLLPQVNNDHCAVEIGSGGGRWTRYMLGFRKLYAVDYYSALLEEIAKNVKAPNIKLIKNNGTDFPGIDDRSVDYLFSFGTFVHLDGYLIQAYLGNMKRILKAGARANVVIHYSDKTKVMGQLNESFAENTPTKMRSMLVEADYEVCEEDLTTMWHNSIIRFTI